MPQHPKLTEEERYFKAIQAWEKKNPEIMKKLYAKYKQRRKRQEMYLNAPS